MFYLNLWRKWKGRNTCVWTAISVIAEEKHKKSGFKVIRICASKITGTRSWFQYYLVSSIGLPLSPSLSDQKVLSPNSIIILELTTNDNEENYKQEDTVDRGRKMKTMNLVMKNWSIKFSSVLQLVEDLLRKELQEEQEGTLLLRLRNPGN